VDEVTADAAASRDSAVIDDELVFAAPQTGDERHAHAIAKCEASNDMMNDALLLVERRSQDLIVVRVFHPALRQQILDVSRTQAETMVVPHGVADDRGRKTIASTARPLVSHRLGLPDRR
jgi:hypothetical protein